MVALGPFNISNPDSSKMQGDGVAEIERCFQEDFSLALDGFDEKSLGREVMKMLSDRPVALAIRGGRRFRPLIEGSNFVEGAWIVTFKHNLRTAGRTWMDHWKSSGSRTESVSGSEVVFQAVPHTGPLQLFFYFAHPKPNTLVFATDLAYLTSVLERMKKRATTRALPEELLEWKHLDATAKVWALRHYDHKDATFDITSPVGKPVDFKGDDQAVGLLFWTDTAKGEANVKYLSTNKDALRIADAWKKGEDGRERICTIRREHQGVISITVPLERAAGRKPDPGRPGSDDIRPPSDMIIEQLRWAIGQPS
jgi:hypothetical protein